MRANKSPRSGQARTECQDFFDLGVEPLLSNHRKSTAGTPSNPPSPAIFSPIGALAWMGSANDILDPVCMWGRALRGCRRSRAGARDWRRRGSAVSHASDAPNMLWDETKRPHARRYRLGAFPEYSPAGSLR